MKTILLATDGSPSATEATREAIELAHALDASLLAVAVEHLPVPGYGYFGYGEVYAEMTASEHEHAANVLAETALKAEEAGVECETAAVTGPVAGEICRIARERDVEMIVIGAHGWGPVRQLVFGSVSTAVLHDAPCPVLVVRATSALETPRMHAEATAV